MSAQPTTEQPVTEIHAQITMQFVLTDLLLADHNDPRIRELLLARYRQVCSERDLLQRLLFKKQEPH